MTLTSKPSNLLAMVITASLLFTLISLVWSLSGFFSPIPSNFGEYTSSAIFQETAGHILFGLIVGAFSFDIALALICGASSILIDVDHLLSALGLPVLARTAHSAIFAIVAGLAVAYLTRSSQNRPMLFITVIGSILSHLSYDVYAGDGVFPILAPVSYDLYSFPYWTWFTFEISGVILVLITALKVGRPPLLRIQAVKSR